MIFYTLYKTKKNSIEEWTICNGRDENGSYYEIKFGQLNGAMQYKRNYVKGKNIGKSNETTPDEQAEKEAAARWEKQIDKGYTTTIGEKTNIVLPMLAKNYDDEKSKVTFPALVQPKLDGMRVIASLVDGMVDLRSRKGKRLNIPHVQKELESVFVGVYADWILDGEIYIHGVNFNNIISWTKKQQPESSRLEYHVYDSISDEPFEKRYKKLRVLKGLSSSIKIVDTIEVYSHEAIVQTHEEYVKLGYEGVMVRWGNEPYQIDKRSSNLLKYKLFKTDEFEIVGATENTNSPGQCSFYLVTKDGKYFDCKPEGTAEFRERCWADHERLIGEMMTVKYFELTPDGVPRFPVGLEIRNYE